MKTLRTQKVLAAACSGSYLIQTAQLDAFFEEVSPTQTDKFQHLLFLSEVTVKC